MSGQLSESISTAQITMLTQILADPAAVALKAKTSDTEGQVFIQTIEAYKAGYGSKEFKDKIAAQMKDQKAPIADQLLQKFEMMGTLSELAWVIYPFAALFMILLIGGLFVRTITAIIYTILAKALRVNIA
ncbi:MAG: hypothetical protein NTY48_03410 [Candidatus Diapherotrites archaeon]|nr:hypothetical protein [Candidatus Diapherotrites archaeon]